MNYLIFISHFSLSVLMGDIGHLNSIYEGLAGDIPVRVIVKTPGVVPGLADINIRVFSDEISKVTVQPIFWNAGVKGAPPADIAEPVKGEANLYSSQIWLMAFGSYNVNVKIYSGESFYDINVPVNSLATNIKGMDKALGIVLWILLIILFTGAVNIITISYRESTIHPDKNPSAERIKKAKAVLIISSLILTALLYSGYRWWQDVEMLYVKNLYKPLESISEQVKISGEDVLRITITDPSWIEGRNPALIPDHGKIMHMYLAKDDMSVLSHIHPSRSIENNRRFDVLMPPIPEGNYSIYMDITYETGFTETIQSSIEFSPQNYSVDVGTIPVRDSDDSWSNRETQHRIVWLDEQAEYLSGEEINLGFQAFNSKMFPTKLEPYIQMGGHGALISPENNVFIHFHPIGTISMASQEVFDKQQQLDINAKSGICYYGLPADTTKTYNEGIQSNIGRVNFPPITLDKLGKYFMWVQVKTEGEVVTERFSFRVGS